ncbi:MAG: PD-(D/E)XK nuclease family protein [Verrucomicrobiota bacterium]|nr:MAG: PD-(D/E)XK nuclease family protein [Verrucomicrobiota bacterium]
MPGFVTSDFRSIQQDLSSLFSALDHHEAISTCALCPSQVVILYLRQFTEQHFPNLAGIAWFTFEDFLEWVLQQNPEIPHIVTRHELLFLLRNRNIPCTSPEASFKVLRHNPETEKIIAAELHRLGWITPEQFLCHQDWGKVFPQKIFQHFLLFGITASDPLYLSAPFARLCKTIAKRVTYFAFDLKNGVVPMHKTLGKNWDEVILRPSLQNASSVAEKVFSIVDGDTGTYITQSLAQKQFPNTSIPTETTAIICFTEADAVRIAYALQKKNLPFLSGFRAHTSNLRDNFLAAWLYWQRTERLEDFIDFYTAWQKLQPTSPREKPIREILAEAFALNPTRDINTLRQNLPPHICEFLQNYPLLPKEGLLGVFTENTETIFPNIFKKFPADYAVTKNAFLDFIEIAHHSQPQHPYVSCKTSIYLLDLTSVRLLSFNRIIVFLGNEVPEKSLEALRNLNAPRIDFLTERTSQSSTFSLLYHQVTETILSPDRVSTITVHCRKNENRSSFPELEHVHQERTGPQKAQSIFAYTRKTDCIRLSTTAIEHAYTHSESVWYRHILKNAPTTLDFEPKKWAGIWTHQLLAFPNTTLPELREMQMLIQAKALELIPSTPRKSVLNNAVTNALRIAEKLGTNTEYPYLTSEIDLQTPLCLSDGTEIPICGRADAILSKKPFRNNFHSENAQNDLILIDYKTGATSTKDLKKLAKKYTRLPDSLTGFQLVLYGWILRTMNYKNIQLLILNPDPYAPVELIPIDSILDGDNQLFFEHYLRSLLIEGAFGYEFQSPFISYSFVLPIAEIAPAKEILLAQKIKRLWDPIFSEQK